MICPNCNKEMQYKAYYYYGFDSWDVVSPDQLYEEYRCPYCDTNFTKDKIGKNSHNK